MGRKVSREGRLSIPSLLVLRPVIVLIENRLCLQGMAITVLMLLLEI